MKAEKLTEEQCTKLRREFRRFNKAVENAVLVPGITARQAVTILLRLMEVENVSPDMIATIRGAFNRAFGAVDILDRTPRARA